MFKAAPTARRSQGGRDMTPDAPSRPLLECGHRTDGTTELPTEAAALFAGVTAMTDMRLTVKHLHEEPVPPSRRAEQPVPPELDDLVLACLRKNPDERPADAGELLRRLSRCDQGPWNQGSAESWWERHMPNHADPGPWTLDLGKTAVAANASVCRV
jgi:serine/threonine protein kinase